MSAYTQEQATKDVEALRRRADQIGDPRVAGILRVEAANCADRIGMRKAHCPPVGPYTNSNPNVCIHCGAPVEQWVKGEECVP